jgi:diadenosine tetraphosphate (Ap4A) HIT family hydrolase
VKKTTTPDNARNKDQQNIIKDFLDRGEDPFSPENIVKIHDNQGVYNKIIYENNEWYVIKNLWPLVNSKDHFVVICKRPIKTITQMNNKEVAALFEAQSWVIKTHAIKGGAFCMRFGNPKISGTTCTRLHGHILSPQKSTTVEFYVGQFKNRLNK